MKPNQTIWGIGEIAQVFGVSEAAVRKWRREADWPEPYAVIGKALVWQASDVRRWVARRRPKHSYNSLKRMNLARQYRHHECH